MANPFILTEEQALSVLGEAMGAISYNLHEAYITKYVQENTKDVEKQLLPKEEAFALARSCRHVALLSLGYASFVCPWERYCRLSAADARADVAVASSFGMASFSEATRDVFTQRFPRSVVEVWRNLNPTPQWFGSCLRNAFAHGQAKLVSHPTLGAVMDIKNYPPNSQNPNLHLKMPIADLEELVKWALAQFVTNAVQGGEFEPLSKLLALEWNFARAPIRPVE